MVCVRAPKGELPAANLFQPLFCPWDSIPERDGYKIEALDSAKLKPDSLTCQPRIFSPAGNSFITYTTISFVLDQPAHITTKVYNVGAQLAEWITLQQTFSQGKQDIRWPD